MESAPRSYSSLQIALHWTIAALVVFQLLVHDGMVDAFEASMHGEPVGGNIGWAYLHIGVGVSVLLLAIVRLTVRLNRGAPPVHHDKPEFLVWLAYTTHILLYTFIFLMPLSGAIAWFFELDFSAGIHVLAKNILIPLVTLHVVGALTEHFVLKNDTLVRMLGLQRWAPERTARAEASALREHPRP
jgi:cytochrome b561